MKWQGLEQLKANEKKGVSMALVLCVSAFFMSEVKSARCKN